MQQSSYKDDIPAEEIQTGWIIQDITTYGVCYAPQYSGMSKCKHKRKCGCTVYF